MYDIITLASRQLPTANCQPPTPRCPFHPPTPPRGVAFSFGGYLGLHEEEEEEHHAEEKHNGAAATAAAAGPAAAAVPAAGGAGLEGLDLRHAMSMPPMAPARWAAAASPFLQAGGSGLPVSTGAAEGPAAAAAAGGPAPREESFSGRSGRCVTGRCQWGSAGRQRLAERSEQGIGDGANEARAPSRSSALRRRPLLRCLGSGPSSKPLPEGAA